MAYVRDKACPDCVLTNAQDYYSRVSIPSSISAEAGDQRSAEKCIHGPASSLSIASLRDPKAVVDTYGPPNHFPFSVIFSPESKLNDHHMQSIGRLPRQIEYLNVAYTALTDAGLTW